MKYYAAIQSLWNQDRTPTFRQAHLDFLEKSVAEGKIFAMGRFLDGAGGLTIYQAESLEEARSAAEADPYVINQVRRVEVHEWAMKIQS